jgi:hypothetical protein
MMIKPRSFLLILITALAGTQAYASRVYTTGRLLDATTDERLAKGTSLRRAIYTVQVNDIIYTLQGEKVKPNTKDITKGLIVGDPVEASVDGEHVYLHTAKGKQIKTDIMKRARAQNP